MTTQQLPDNEWHKATEDEISSISQGSHPLLLTVAATIILFILWAGWCELDEITRGEGRVIPSSQIQNIQNMEGGIIEAIVVTEGDIVEKDQVLMVMDDTRFAATQSGQMANRHALLARQARLRAEVEGTEVEMPELLLNEVPVLAAREKELFENRQLEIKSSIGIFEQQLTQQKKQSQETNAQRDMLKSRLALLTEELNLAKELAEEGAVSRVEVLRLERQVSDTRGEKIISEKNLERIAAQQNETLQRINETRLNFINKARRELNETLAMLHELSAKETAVSDQVERTRVRAPMKGVVKQILVNTEGGVVQPGMVMMELIPVDDTLEVEARVRPQDIAFLHPGQKAMVRFTAYDFTIYGGIEGELTHISADTITDEQGESFYLARIKTKRNFLGEEGDKSRPVIVGMVATIDILTGKKTLLEYLLKPVLRAKHLAFSER